VAGLGKDEARLAALHREPPRELAGVLIAPVRRLGIHLGVQFLQLARERGGLLPAEQLERYPGRGHGHLPRLSYAQVRMRLFPGSYIERSEVTAG
jgi:hypothetical protein